MHLAPKKPALFHDFLSEITTVKSLQDRFIHPGKQNRFNGGGIQQDIAVVNELLFPEFCLQPTPELPGIRLY